MPGMVSPATFDRPMHLAIDASNIRRGGGATHLAEILGQLDPARHGIERVDLWAPGPVLERIPESAVVQKHRHPAIDAGGWRTWRFQSRGLDRLIPPGTDLLWSPGGTCLGRFRPAVTMARNLLPFVPAERRRYGCSRGWLRLVALERVQSRNFRRSSGVIFVSEEARRVVTSRVELGAVPQATIHHGIGEQFRMPPRPPRPFTAFTPEAPARLLYVSQLTFYKHQDVLVEAVATLRAQGIPIVLDLVGPTYPGYARRFAAVVRRHDPTGAWVRIHGEVSPGRVREFLRDADLFTALSTCETFGMFMLEAMAAGLPVLASSRSVLPEIAGGSCPEVDPEDRAAVAAAIRGLLADAERRGRAAAAAFERSKSFSWRRCADETFEFLHGVTHP
jgi:glycosyltransferase involved in cell wall biosynthesis